MRAFITQQMDDSKELRSKLKLVESELAAAQKTIDKVAESLRTVEGERETTNAEARQLREEGKTDEAQCKKTEQKNKWLKNEVEELQTGFAAQKEVLEGESQKQVDDMFFFGYQCSMKKHGITQDTPNYSLDDEETTAGDLAREEGDIATVSPSGGQT